MFWFPRKNHLIHSKCILFETSSVVIADRATYRFFFLVLQPDDRGGQVDRISWFLPQGICFCKLMSSFPSICCYLAKQDSSVCVILCVVHGLCSIYCHNNIYAVLYLLYTRVCTVPSNVQLYAYMSYLNLSYWTRDASSNCSQIYSVMPLHIYSIAACISPKLGFIQNLCLFI